MTDISPTLNGYWIDNPTEEFATSLPIATKQTKNSRIKDQERAIFKLFSLGVATNRDGWVYDKDKAELIKKMKFFISNYESERARWRRAGRPNSVANWVKRDIKWTSELEASLCNDRQLKFQSERIRMASYRPFSREWSYYDHSITHRPYQNDKIFPIEGIWNNTVIIFTGPSAQKTWTASASSDLIDLHYVGAAAGSVCVSRFFLDNGDWTDNVTDWALDQFIAFYTETNSLTKDDIFAYVYAVLYDPLYRDAYAINLVRDFPRIPFYKPFRTWRDWGKTLLDLHINYESATPFPLKRTDTPDKKSATPRPILRADRDNGIIILDTQTQLAGIPAAAWDYKLGNRSALDWVLDQHKEKTPKDPTIREKFNTYRFADHKEKVIDLLKRVTTVSLETVKITEAMRKLPRSPPMATQ